MLAYFKILLWILQERDFCLTSEKFKLERSISDSPEKGIQITDTQIL